MKISSRGTHQEVIGLREKTKENMTPNHSSDTVIITGDKKDELNLIKPPLNFDSLVSSSSVKFVKDPVGNDVFPKNWRKTSDPFIEERINSPLPSRAGLDTLKASGSSSFTKEQFDGMCKELEGENITVFDLRQESHGLLNDICVSWYKASNTVNRGKTREQIIKDEKSLLEGIKKEDNVQVEDVVRKEEPLDLSTWETRKYYVTTGMVKSEEQIVTEKGHSYERITVADHHRPTDEDVNKFIECYKNLPQDQWVHFHCRAGKGRTTTFMVIYDMMRNFDKASMEDIIQRQHLLGGVNLNDLDKPDYKKDWATEKLAFVKNFHQYCQECGPHYRVLWTDWLKKNS